MYGKPALPPKKEAREARAQVTVTAILESTIRILEHEGMTPPPSPIGPRRGAAAAVAARMGLTAPNAPIRYSSVITNGDELVLDTDAMKALVFRGINVREAFTLVDASGVSWRASLKLASAEGGRAVAYERMSGSTESPAAITLVCAVLGRQRMIFVVQKATELGVIRIVPVLSDKSVQPKDLEHEKPWAWRGQALKGAKQCRRASVPEVLDTMLLAKALQAPWWTDSDPRLVLDDVAESDPLPAAAGAGPNERAIVLAVGPEGGWSDRERALLKERGAISLALGTRVLRAETAVLAGLSIVQHRFGDLRPPRS